MGCEDVRVTWIENCLFERLSGERLGVLNEVRIEWVFSGNERRECRGCAATRSPELLPQRRARTGPSSSNDHIHAGDVDAEFECVGGGECANAARAEAVFECSPLLGEESAPICRDGVRPRGSGCILGMLLTHERRDVLDGAPAAQKCQDLASLAHRGRGQRRGVPCRGRATIVCG